MFQKAKTWLIVLLLCVVIINRALSQCSPQPPWCSFEVYDWCDWQAEGWEFVGYRSVYDHTIRTVGMVGLMRGRTTGRLESRTTICSGGQRHCVFFNYAFFQDEIADLNIYIRDVQAKNDQELLWTMSSSKKDQVMG
jgi:hypothetical protein